MRKIPLFLGICVLSANILSFGQNDEAKLNASEKAYILSRFCGEVKYNFAFYDKVQFDWDSLCMSTMPTLVQTDSDEDFIKGMQALCARLQDGHTYVFPMNNPQNPADWVRPFPMKTKRIGDRVFVTDVYSSLLHDAGVIPGCEILEIDGENVLEYAQKQIQPYLASSTPQWMDYRPFAEFELTKERGSKVSEILFRNKKGGKFTVKRDRNISWDLQNSTPSIAFRVMDGNMGLLTVRSFQDSDFDRALFDKLYDGILKTDGLIIDIRDNGGGNSAHADYLVSHFSDQAVPQGSWSSPMYIAAHGSWNYPKEWYIQTPDPIQPVKNREIYKKPVVLLVNSTTFSSAENFCVSFRGAGRGKIIGTPTGGSTGNPIFLDLGGGVGCCICTKHELDAEGKEFIGYGIQPDIVVEEDLEMFLQGRDNVVEKGLEILRTCKNRS